MYDNFQFSGLYAGVPGNTTKLENPNIAFQFNYEYLNALQPNGYPQHNFILK